MDINSRNINVYSDDVFDDFNFRMFDEKTGSGILKVDLEINPIYIQMLQIQHRYQLVYGGSSSGKSYFINGQRVMLDLLEGERNYLIVRKSAKSIRTSSFKEVKKALNSRPDLRQHFKIKEQEMSVKCLLTGKEAVFSGLDDVEKIKSLTFEDGVLTDVVVEEATDITYQDFKQLDKRLRGPANVNKRITLLFNPVLRTHWIYDHFFNKGEVDETKQVNQYGKVFILKTTYKDNMYLEDDDIRALEDEEDNYFYQVYTLGNWGVLANTIFNNWRVEDFGDLEEIFDNHSNGLDWGFANDPLAAVRIHLDKRRKRLYIIDEEVHLGMGDDESAPLVKAMIGKEKIICDSEDPKSIANYKKLGVHAVGAKKGPGSVRAGIKTLQYLEILIHPRCVNTIKEFTHYKFKEDRHGNVQKTPIDAWNHCIDAIRYAMEEYDYKPKGWKKRGTA